jgi:ABC-type amino acid transport substrate-binding protein
MPVTHGTFLALLLAALSAATAASDTGDAAGAHATVATRQVPPFAMRVEGGWDGIAIELLRRIADGTGKAFDLKEMTLAQMLDAAVKGEVDAVAAALTITAERERVMDFSHPFYTSGLGVAVRQRSEVTWLSALKRIGSGAFVQSLAALLGVLTLVGVLVWVAERRRNHQFQQDALKGIGSGIWWSAVTMTTVGYGDKAPLTLAGRIIGLVWMFASVILISGFTAAIASSLTLGELDQTIRGVDDLRGKRVLTLENSTSAAYLEDKLIRYRSAPDLDDALGDLEAGRADAVVYDAPILRYLVNEHHAASLRVLPTVLARQEYGIGLPPGSPLREEINRQILEITRTPEWTHMLGAYLGPEG